MLGDSGAGSVGLAGATHVLRRTGLVLGQVVGTGVVRDTILEDPGIGGSGVSSITSLSVVSLQEVEDTRLHVPMTSSRHTHTHSHTHTLTHTHTHTHTEEGLTETQSMST